jgi:hypothetical protein
MNRNESITHLIQIIRDLHDNIVEDVSQDNWTSHLSNAVADAEEVLQGNPESQLCASCLTSEQVDAIKHAYLDCLATADIDNVNTDLGNLAEAAKNSAEELEQAFSWLNQKSV